MSENDRPQLTHHAMLIPWGQYAQCLGLTEQMAAVPIQQKTVDHSPQVKVQEFLVANLAGLAHLKEISLAAHPLDQDKVVAQAWGQTSWADCDGDLSGRPISDTSRTYPEVAYGHMDDQVRLG